MLLRGWRRFVDPRVPFICFAWLALALFLRVGDLHGQVPECDCAELNVGEASGRAGDTVEVEVRGGVTCDVSGFIIAVGHDNTQLKFLAAAPGPFVSDHAGEELLFRVTEHNADGYAVIGAVFDFSVPLTVPSIPIPKETLLATLTYEIDFDALQGSVPLLNRTRTFGDGNLVANVFSGDMGAFSVDPVLVDGVVTVTGFNADFRRGDANGDQDVDLSDASFILNFLFIGGEQPECLQSADANDDGELDLSDASFVLNFLFVSGESLPPPAGVCGSDMTADSLSCDLYPCS
jgi:hypothetical protein